LKPVWATQAAGDSDRPYLGPGFGGTSVSSVIFVDTVVIPAINIGTELSLAGDIRGMQRQRVLGRGHLLRDKDRLPDGVVRRGVSSAIVRYGVGAQVGF